MDRTSFEDLNRGKRYFLIFVLVIFVSIGAIVGLFTTSKAETLICIKDDNVCNIEKTNLLNMKSSKKITELSQIASVTYIPQRVSGNMYARGYSSYYLAFLTKNNKKIKVFSNDYYEKEELDAIILEIKEKLKSDDKMFKITQKL